LLTFCQLLLTGATISTKPDYVLDILGQHVIWMHITQN